MKIVAIVVGGLSLIMAFVVFTAVSWGISANNSMVTKQEAVNSSWSQVENVYQRRSDLIPNLVNTVKGYAKHEADVLEQVTQARASVGQVKINANDAGDLAKFQQAQTGLSQALSHLMVISENYPELKADKGFLELQSQLEGTENRISVERKKFNDAAQEYNTYILQFPTSVIAGYRNFTKHPYFEAETSAKVAPKVNF
jgi:LemA protein